MAAGVGWWACTKEQVQIKQWLNILVFPILLDSIQVSLPRSVFEFRWHVCSHEFHAQFLVQNYFLKNKELLKEQQQAIVNAAMERDARYGSTV